ncbi:MAG: FtsX-like permease family protein [Saprospiraceae bacterium]|nr:FtsX-like permease family protein [Saprospiraceae bacterium]
MKFHLQPFFDMHLDPEYFASNGMKNWSDIKYPKILSGIALLLILIASINFINLTLARSLQRSKEIGIRKTSGGTKSQLFFQFITESGVMTAVASLPAIFVAYALLPEFSKLTGKYLDTQCIAFAGIYFNLFLTRRLDCTVCRKLSCFGDVRIQTDRKSKRQEYFWIQTIPASITRRNAICDRRYIVDRNSLCHASI